MLLRPHDVVVLVKIETLAGERWSYGALSNALKISSSTIHEGLRTAAAAKLFDPNRKVTIQRNLFEFLVHGVKYCFPPQKGTMVRGVPTSYAASPLVSLFPASNVLPPVWPYASGMVQGLSFEPLYPAVPVVALSDPRLGELLALIDALRDGRPRESKAAIDELRKRLPRD